MSINVKGILIVFFCMPLVSCFAQNAAIPSFLNPNLPISQRVQDLIGRMTLDEKISQMQHTAAAIPRLSIPQYNWWNEALHG
ncbi:hypothetical protein JXO59_06625, partial [candidate division KSB1 bacterium]|nr:hypothetical protein [candidate division KSB1 bacterium]